LTEQIDCPIARLAAGILAEPPDLRDAALDRVLHGIVAAIDEQEGGPPSTRGYIIFTRVVDALMAEVRRQVQAAAEQQRRARVQRFRNDPKLRRVMIDWQPSAAMRARPN
jgi:hypothetical protein